MKFVRGLLGERKGRESLYLPKILNALIKHETAVGGKLFAVSLRLQCSNIPENYLQGFPKLALNNCLIKCPTPYLLHCSKPSPL